MILSEFLNNLDRYFNNGLQYSERAKRDMEIAHIDETILKKLLSEVKEIVPNGDSLILRIKRTSKIYVQVEQDKLSINSVAYNPTAMVI